MNVSKLAKDINIVNQLYALNPDKNNQLILITYNEETKSTTHTLCHIDLFSHSGCWPSTVCQTDKIEPQSCNASQETE